MASWKARDIPEMGTEEPWPFNKDLFRVLGRKMPLVGKKEGGHWAEPHPSVAQQADPHQNPALGLPEGFLPLDVTVVVTMAP